MILTNKYNLPQPLVAAVKNDLYSYDGDRSTTGLILPPRIYQLRKRYDAKIEEDVADNIWRLVGNNTHDILERAGMLMKKLKHLFGAGVIVEKRFNIKMLGWKVGGKIDLYEEAIGRLTDWKVTSVWSAVHGVKPEHEQQLNMNAYFMYENDIFHIRTLWLVLLLRDWSKYKVERGTDYPKCQVAVQNVRLWSYSATKRFVAERIRLHQASETMSDEALLPCTDEERWKKPDVYAVMRKCGKRALRLLTTHEKAEAWIKNNKKGDEIVFRPGSYPRCEDYCSAAPFCSQYQAVKDKAMKLNKK